MDTHLQIPDGIISPPTSRASSPESPCLSSEDLKIHDKLKREDEKYQEKVLKQMKSQGTEELQKQLMHLLEKSSIYTKFILNRIQAEEDERKIKEDAVKREVKQRSKRKRTEVSNVIDKDEVVKRQKMNEKGDISLANSQSSISSNSEEVLKELQPKLVTGAVLRDYQLYGVNWLKSLYDNGMNGILADEMGLGKTIQSIGMIAKLMEVGMKGPFLVVVPLSTLHNWHKEFRKFAPEIECFVFHGSKHDRPNLIRRFNREANYSIPSVCLRNLRPVLLTSYEMVMLEAPFFEGHAWKFLIVDEGHRLKNMNCQLIRQLKRLPSNNRLLLTGTPLQNNLSELWSLLNFILPNIFDDLESFQTLFDFSGSKDEIIANEKEGQVLSKLHQILKPFLLRRIKQDVELEIPPKTEVHVYATATSLQKEFYRAIIENRIHDFLRDKDGPEPELEKSEKGLRKLRRVDYTEDKDVLGKDGYVDVTKWKGVKHREALPIGKCKVPSSAISALRTKWVQLKKTVNHPYLLSYPCDEEGYAIVNDDILNLSGKMLLLDRMLPKLTEGVHKVLIFSTMTKFLDIMEDYLDYKDWKYSRLDGSMNLDERNQQVEQFQEDPNYRIFLVSTRAGGLGLNLMAADSVVIMDSDWNPQCDLQAQARAHRIGQKRKVMVYRFLLKNTIDQKIVERGISKRVLEKMVIHKGKFKRHDADGGITEADIQELFESEALSALQSDFEPQDVLSDTDLNALTDRDNPLPKSDAYTVVEETTCKY